MAVGSGQLIDDLSPDVAFESDVVQRRALHGTAQCERWAFGRILWALMGS